MNKHISIATTQISYRVVGTGSPVMLVHGFGEDGSVWRFLENKLAASHRLIIPDLPGSGSSGELAAMDMKEMAETLAAILQAEGLINHTPVTMIGHSMGGYVTLAFAANYPGSLNGFGLFHSSAFADTEEKKATRRKGIEFIRKNGAFAFLKNSTPQLFSPGTQEKNPELINDQLDSLRNFSATALVKYYEGMIARPDHTALLRETPLPVLFVAGKYDSAVPLQDVLKQCHLPGKSYFHTLSESGHMGMLEEPELSIKIVEQFLADINSMFP